MMMLFTLPREVFFSDKTSCPLSMVLRYVFRAESSKTDCDVTYLQVVCGVCGATSCGSLMSLYVVRGGVYIVAHDNR